MPAALSLSHYYKHLSYYAHALEILLHNVLDETVAAEESKSGAGADGQTPQSLLPSVISFLQASLPADVYLDIIVQCTRKNEIRSWRTLFAHLPPPKDLFEQALRLKSLKTAAGYLLVLQALDEEEDGSDARIEDSAVRLLRLAAQREDWDLCAELARFLVALDSSGGLLQRAIDRVGLRRSASGTNDNSISMKGLGLALPSAGSSSSLLSPQRIHRQDSDLSSGTRASSRSPAGDEETGRSEASSGYVSPMESPEA